MFTVRLISGDLFDVEGPPLAIDSLDLTLSALEGTAHDLHGVALADGHRSHAVLGSQVLTQVTTHDLSSETGGGREVSLAGLSTLAGDALVGLHLFS